MSCRYSIWWVIFSITWLACNPKFFVSMYSPFGLVVSHLKKNRVTPAHDALLLVSSKSSLVLALTLRSMVSFSLELRV